MRIYEQHQDATRDLDQATVKGAYAEVANQRSEAKQLRNAVRRQLRQVRVSETRADAKRALTLFDDSLLQYDRLLSAIRRGVDAADLNRGLMKVASTTAAASGLLKNITEGL